MNNIRSTLATVWQIAAPYFRSEDRWAGRGLLAAVIAIELAVVFLTVLFNRWNNVFYNALQERNLAVFTYQIGYFCVLATFWIGLKVYQLYLNQWLQIRWRQWMTRKYLAHWLTSGFHYRMQVLGKNKTLMRWLKHRGGAQHAARDHWPTVGVQSTANFDSRNAEREQKHGLNRIQQRCRMQRSRKLLPTHQQAGDSDSGDKGGKRHQLHEHALPESRDAGANQHKVACHVRGEQAKQRNET